MHFDGEFYCYVVFAAHVDPVVQLCFHCFLFYLCGIGDILTISVYIGSNFNSFRNRSLSRQSTIKGIQNSHRKKLYMVGVFCRLLPGDAAVACPVKVTLASFLVKHLCKVSYTVEQGIKPKCPFPVEKVPDLTA